VLRLALVIATITGTFLAASGLPAAPQSQTPPPLPFVAAPAELGTYVLHLDGPSGVLAVAAGPADSFNPSAWSPDGSKLARAGADGSLDIVDTAAGTATHLDAGGQATLLLRWSPDGSRLAYSDGDSIRIAGSDGTPADLIVSLPPRPSDEATDASSAQPAAAHPFTDFAWTPDGQSLTTLQVYRDTTGRWLGQVSSVDASTGMTVATLLSGTSAACFASMSWSPDGSYLAFAGPKRQPCPDGASPNGLWTWEAASGTVRKLHDGGVVAAKWMDGGRLVAEVCCGNPPAAAQTARYVLERFQADQPNGTILVNGLSDPFPAPYDSAFDVGGGTVSYRVSDCRAGTASVWAVDARGGTPRQVSDPTSYIYRPRLSPDGTLVAWIRPQPDGSELDVGALDGSPARAVLVGASGLDDLTWSPDGGSLSFDVAAQQPDDCIGH